jgi:hypothetical protein
MRLSIPPAHWRARTHLYRCLFCDSTPRIQTLLTYGVNHMASNFVDLCNAFCEVAGLAEVPPERDEEGAMAARFTLGDTDVELMSESESAQRCFSRVVFGPLPSGDEPAQWDELLETNFLIYRPGGAAFSRDPWTGNAVLQQSWPAATAPQALFSVISQQCQTAWSWRNGTLTLPAFAKYGANDVAFNKV